ncbi:hypothetical protein [Metabacillus litoralis]|uniref:hypothetical protein n=1 Tax=Metabacillus TaxID=2675233 RepID=UPI001B9EB5CA|nr:hypothetical protein [Metabacillus litoralis]MCM3164544.1 hypothetical protein [Metabacillus litoralis]
MEQVKIKVPYKVKNDVFGFTFLLNLFEETKKYSRKHIILEFNNTRWFEANLVAVLGAWIEFHRKSNKISFTFENLSKRIRKVFMKNGFYEFYNLGSERDDYGSTISYRIFNVDEEEIFIKYIQENVIPKIQLELETKVAKGFISSLTEIFVNVDLHAKSNEVITCGQYYYKNKKVCFTIVDIGQTIGNNVKRKLKNPFISDSESIDWATKWGNTTKAQGEPGGIGLHIIDEFLEKNGGTFQIISGSGYWEKKNNYVNFVEMDSYFPGTIVNIQSSLENTFEDMSLHIEF